MKYLSKTSLLMAAAATAITASTPTLAQHNRNHHNDRDNISAGEIIAGALVIGGIAAIATAGSRGNQQYSNNSYNNSYGYYQNGYNGRSAVEQCVRAAERSASRYGRARITDVSKIDRVRGGYEVRGRLVVAGRQFARNGYNGWDQYGYNYDRYDNNYDKGKFSCVTRYGGVQNVRVTGLRG